MAVDESLGALSSVAGSNTPGGTDTVGPDLDDHLRDIKKNTRIVGETSQGPTAPAGFIGRQRLATSATASNTLTHQMHDGSAYRSLYDLDTSAGTISRFYTRKGSLAGDSVSGTLSGVSVVSSFFDGSATGTFRGFFTGTASGVVKGQVLANDGSSAAPSLAFADDPNTGWFRSGSNAAVLVTGGSKRFKAESDGTLSGPTVGGWEQIGVGTASAGARIEFANIDEDKYSSLRFRVNRCVPANVGENFMVHISEDNGSTYKSASYDIALSLADSSTSAPGTLIASGATRWTLANDVGSGGVSGVLEIPIHSGDVVATWTGGNRADTNGALFGYSGSVGVPVSGALDAVRFGFIVGDFSAVGEIVAYGLRKA